MQGFLSGLDTMWCAACLYASKSVCLLEFEAYTGSPIGYDKENQDPPTKSKLQSTNKNVIQQRGFWNYFPKLCPFEFHPKILLELALCVSLRDVTLLWGPASAFPPLVRLVKFRSGRLALVRMHKRHDLNKQSVSEKLDLKISQLKVQLCHLDFIKETRILDAKSRLNLANLG